MYLNPGEMPEAGEGERDGGVHVGAGDVPGGVDHDGDDEAADDGLPELRHPRLVLYPQPMALWLRRVRSMRRFRWKARCTGRWWCMRTGRRA